MVPIQQIVPDALAAVLRKAPLTAEKVEFAWRTAVGPALAKVTTVDLRDKTLRIEARDGNWQREVSRARPVILARLRNVLGDDAVDALEVRAATGLPNRPAGGSGSARRRR